MPTLTKYIKAPVVAGNPTRYIDDELRKIELAASSYLSILEELVGMSSTNFETGSFVATFTGLTITVTATARYVRVGGIVNLYIPLTQGTSNSAGFAITGIPESIRPKTTRQGWQPILCRDNNVLQIGYASVKSDGIIDLLPSNISAWTNSSTKGIEHINLTYNLE